MNEVVRILRAGGIILYPTEGVWGIGCDPFNQAAVTRLLAIKQRPLTKGLILIAASWEEVRELITSNPEDYPAIAAAGDEPITWIFPASPAVPFWIRGQFASIAIRVTQHPVAKNLCQQFGAPLVSTSANLSTQKPAVKLAEIDEYILSRVDYLVHGETGGLATSTRIYDLEADQEIRGLK